MVCPPLENESTNVIVVDSPLVDPKLSSENDDGVVFASPFVIENSEWASNSSIVPEWDKYSTEEAGVIISIDVNINSSKDEKSDFCEFGNELTDNESITEANADEVTARELKGDGDIIPEADEINLSIVEYSMAVPAWWVYCVKDEKLDEKSLSILMGEDMTS